MTNRLHISAAICIALKHDTCLLVVSKVDHYVRIPRKDCNLENITICLTATLIGIRVVVGSWKSLVFTIQIRGLRHTGSRKSP